MVFCAGKKSYFCSQMDSSDKVPACLYTFCPVHSRAGRTASCHCTGSLPWTRCWGVRKHTSGLPLYRCCQTQSWQTVRSWCSKKTYIHIHAYTRIHRILHSLVHRRLQIYMVWLFAIIQSLFLSAISLLWSTEGALQFRLAYSDTICV